MRTFKIIYVDQGIDRNEDGETITLGIDDILEIVNEDHSDEFTPYDETDWIEGLLQFSSYDLILEKGTTMKWTDPDNGECSGDVIVEETIRLTGGFGKETGIVVCSNGEHYANELS